MSYASELVSFGVSPTGAAEALWGLPISRPADRGIMAARESVARERAYQRASILNSGQSLNYPQSQARGVIPMPLPRPQGTIEIPLDERTAAKIRAEIDRLERQIEYWTEQLGRVTSRLKELHNQGVPGMREFYAKMKAAQLEGQPAPVGPGAAQQYASLMAALKVQLEWIKEHLAKLKKQHGQLVAKLESWRLGMLTQNRGALRVGPREATNSTRANRTAAILAELARLEQEMEAARQYLDRLAEDASRPGRPKPPPAAGLAALDDWIDTEKNRQALIRSEIAATHKLIADLETQYVALLMQL